MGLGGVLLRRFYDFFNTMDGAKYAGGANGTEVYDYQAPVRTTVQINSFQHGLFNGPPIASPAVGNYYFSSIDNMFQRGLTLQAATEYFVVDLLTEVMGAHADMVAGVQGYLPGLHATAVGAPGGINANTGPLDAFGNPLFGFFTDWNVFAGGLVNGQFPTARSAAEFVRMFVSDHMPVVIGFNVV